MPPYSMTMNSPVGLLKLTADDLHLKTISFDADFVECESFIPQVLIRAKDQLEAYFSGSLKHFDLPLDPDGTDFQRSVWNHVLEVSYGSTMTYADIARSLGSSTAGRAVGMANARNPLPIIIPCHRIIGQHGKLTGYSGGLERKKWLLLHEMKYSGTGGLF